MEFAEGGLQMCELVEQRLSPLFGLVLVVLGLLVGVRYCNFVDCHGVCLFVVCESLRFVWWWS